MKMIILVLGILLSIQPAYGEFPKPIEMTEMTEYKRSEGDFFYAHQNAAWIIYEVPVSTISKVLGEKLSHLKLEPVTFNDPEVGYILVKPMVFMAQFGLQTKDVPGTSSTTEVETTVLVKPKGSTQAIKSLNEFINGDHKQNEIGQYRVDVLADHEIAVAAGRKNFGEHKFLGSFEYDFTTPNNSLGFSQRFEMNMTAYTWQNASKKESKMFKIKMVLEHEESKANFSPETIYSSFPPEPVENTQTLGGYRYYQNKNFSVFRINQYDNRVHIEFGEAAGGSPLKPVPPFGNAKPIAGSEHWPVQMVNTMEALLRNADPKAVIRYKTKPAEFETKPFEVK